LKIASAISGLPWALCNVLDTYSGATNGVGYSFIHPLYDYVSGVQVSLETVGFLGPK